MSRILSRHGLPVTEAAIVANAKNLLRVLDDRSLAIIYLRTKHESIKQEIKRILRKRKSPVLKPLLKCEKILMEEAECKAAT
jgi:hypothetical protein